MVKRRNTHPDRVDVNALVLWYKVDYRMHQSGEKKEHMHIRIGSK